MMNGTEDHVAFWETWRWQYLLRNTSYLNDYNKCFQSFIVLIKDRLKIDIILFNRDEVEYLYNSIIVIPSQFPVISSEFYRIVGEKLGVNYEDCFLKFNDLLLDWRKKVLKYFALKYKVRPLIPANGTDIDDLLDDIDNAHTYKRKSSLYELCPYGDFTFASIDDGGDMRGDVFWVKIDCRDTVDEVVERVKYYYTIRRNIYEKKPKKLQDISLNICRNNQTLAYIKKSNSKFRIENKPRAIGLWLWDRVNELGAGRGAKIQAIAEFEALPNFANFTLGNDPDYYHWLRRTEACIEAAEVLTFDKKNPESKKRKRPSGTRKRKLVPGTKMAK